VPVSEAPASGSLRLASLRVDAGFIVWLVAIVAVAAYFRVVAIGETVVEEPTCSSMP
jgi:hypothetical protein